MPGRRSGRRDRDRRAQQGIRPGTLTLGTDNGSAFTARATRLVLSGLGVAHAAAATATPRARRSSRAGSATSRNAASGATSSRPSTIAREVIGAYINHYHDRPQQPARLPTAPKSAKLVTKRQEHYKTSGLTCQPQRGALQHLRLLVPGGLTGWLSWIPDAERLSASWKTIRVQPIHNELGSAGQPGDPSYTAETERESLRMTLDALGIREAHFAG